MTRAQTAAWTPALVTMGFLAGLILGAFVGYGARRPVRVLCTSTLRVEPLGPGAWTLVCEGGR